MKRIQTVQNCILNHKSHRFQVLFVASLCFLFSQNSANAQGTTAPEKASELRERESVPNRLQQSIDFMNKKKGYTGNQKRAALKIIVDFANQQNPTAIAAITKIIKENRLGSFIQRPAMAAWLQPTIQKQITSEQARDIVQAMFVSKYVSYRYILASSIEKISALDQKAQFELAYEMLCRELELPLKERVLAGHSLRGNRDVEFCTSDLVQVLSNDTKAEWVTTEIAKLPSPHGDRFLALQIVLHRLGGKTKTPVKVETLVKLAKQSKSPQLQLEFLRAHSDNNSEAMVSLAKQMLSSLVINYVGGGAITFPLRVAAVEFLKTHGLEKQIPTNTITSAADPETIVRARAAYRSMRYPSYIITEKELDAQIAARKKAIKEYQDKTAQEEHILKTKFPGVYAFVTQKWPTLRDSKSGRREVLKWYTENKEEWAKCPLREKMGRVYEGLLSEFPEKTSD
jgi:hypothetical protein